MFGSYGSGCSNALVSSRSSPATRILHFSLCGEQKYRFFSILSFIPTNFKSCTQRECRLVDTRTHTWSFWKYHQKISAVTFPMIDILCGFDCVSAKMCPSYLLVMMMTRTLAFNLNAASWINNCNNPSWQLISKCWRNLLIGGNLFLLLEFSWCTNTRHHSQLRTLTQPGRVDILLLRVHESL